MPRFRLDHADALLTRAQRQRLLPPSAQSRHASVALGVAACRAALQAFYEQAGLAIDEIERLPEDIRELLAVLDRLNVDTAAAAGDLRIGRATRLRACRVGGVGLGGTVGAILERAAAESQPDPEVLRVNPGGVPPDLVTAAAARVVRFVREHWDDVQRASS